MQRMLSRSNLPVAFERPGRIARLSLRLSL